MTIACVPGVSGCRSATQPCATDSPAVPAGSPKMLSAGRTIFRSRVSTSATGTNLPSTVTVGGNLHVGPARASPQFVLRCPVALERAALERGRCDEDLGAGLHGARLDADGRKRCNGATTKVEARECGTAGAEGVLSARCLKHRRPRCLEIALPASSPGRRWPRVQPRTASPQRVARSERNGT